MKKIYYVHYFDSFIKQDYSFFTSMYPFEWLIRNSKDGRYILKNFFIIDLDELTSESREILLQDLELYEE